MTRPLLATLVLCAACAMNNQSSGDAGVDLDIGGIPFRAASGTTRLSDSLAIYLTDQPDACLAVTQVPVGAATIFWLRVAPQLDGTTSATVVANQVTPGPGQAVGAIVAQTGGVQTGGYDVRDGSVVWMPNEDGTTTIVSLDVGFEGATARLRVSDVTVPPCP